jgi:signal transduction histidine kinase
MGNFSPIGEVSFTQGGQELFFELNCRLNQDHLELLFNDVTRTKLIEKANDELKQKSLFFSKITHEFKNPLICVCELINQTYDMVSESETENKILFSNLDQIKSLANYLQILIKDFTHFSENQFGEITTFEEQETDLFSVVDFCKKICNSLLIKSNKNENIQCNFNIDKSVPKKIKTDEWRLKQILINLLSNSIKFTLLGKITLDVSLDEQLDFLKSRSNQNNRIKFEVKDTGLGMKEDVFKDLSSPFKKVFCKEIKKQNQLGCGLGLSIANEIASKLGEGLECESKLGEGTTFWFYIPIKNELIVKEPEVSLLVIDDQEDDSKSYCSKVLSVDETFLTQELFDYQLTKPNPIDSQQSLNSNESDESDEIAQICKNSHTHSHTSIKTVIKNEKQKETNYIFSNVRKLLYKN